MPEYLSATQAALHLGVHEKTVRRWITEGKLPATRVKINRYAIDADDLANLLHKQEPSPDEILRRLDAINEHLLALEHQINTLHTELHLILDVLQRQEPPQPVQPRQTPTIAKQPLSTSHSAQKEASEIVWLTPELAAWRSFSRVHGISEATVYKAIQKGRLPVVEGEWKRGKTYKDALDQAGRQKFYKLYHNNPRFVHCSDCPH